MIHKLIPFGINPPSALLPQWLDKPLYSTASHTYADILKKQFSITSNTANNTNDNNWPPWKRQATKLDYDLDASVDAMTMTTVTNATTSTCNQTPNMLPTTMMPPLDYVKELREIKMEINQLKNFIITAVENLTQAIASICENTSLQMAMDTEAENMISETSAALPNPPPNQHDVWAMITELKNEIATLNKEMHTMIQQILPHKMDNFTPSSSITWTQNMNQCGSS